MKRKTQQIFIKNLSYPYESVHILFFDSDFIKKIFEDSDYKIKLFIGSDWSIKNSGFSFFGPNGFNSVFELSNIINNDFMRQNTFIISQLNGEKINIELDFEFSIINNTYDNTSIVELRINYKSDEDINILEKYIKIPYIKEIVKEITSKIETLFTKSPKEEKAPKTIINHSFIIKKNYKDAFNFFYNWNNIAKTLKTDKIWKIINEQSFEKDKQEYKNFSIIINEDIKIYYRIVSIKEIKDEKIEIIYDKSGKNYAPALNNYIKFTFYKIDKDLSLFLYETHLPFNIVSSIYQTVSYYLFYCNYQSRKYIESI